LLIIRPTTPTWTDDFLRGNGLVTSSLFWTQIFYTNSTGSLALPTITSHSVTGPAGGAASGAYMIGRNFSGSQIVSAKVTNVGTSGSGFTLMTDYNPALEEWYQCSYLSGTLYLAKGPGFNILAMTSATFSTNDTLTMTSLVAQDGSSNTITCAQSGSASVSVNAADSSAPVISGQPGMQFSGAVAALTNFTVSDNPNRVAP
jgi:hypothetical protein